MRDGAKRIVRLKEGEPRGKHVVIVDDLVQSGGTLIECQKLLAAQARLLLAAHLLLGCMPRTFSLQHPSFRQPLQRLQGG